MSIPNRPMTDWENPTINGVNRVAPHCSLTPYGNAEDARQTGGASDRVISLNGDWPFAYLGCPEDVPADFSSPDFDDSDWDSIAVPGHWQTQGYGHPHYTNVLYPFPADAPFVPRENPTGLYRRRFMLPATAAGQRVFVRFGGVDSAFYLWVNGEKIGFSKGSRVQIGRAHV